MKNFDKTYNKLIKEDDEVAKGIKGIADFRKAAENGIAKANKDDKKPIVSPTSQYFASFDIDDQTIALQRFDDGREVDRYSYDDIIDFKRGILDTVMNSGYQYEVRDKGVYQRGFDLISYIIPKTK